MKIVDVGVKVFTYSSREVKDSDGHTHPGDPHPANNALLTITADDGSKGYCIAAPEAVRPGLIERFVKVVLMGQDPFARERLWQGMSHWQRGSQSMLTDRTLAYVDMALWDLAGRKLGVPVYQLIGSYRDRVPAYASTMCGDELEGGLATPEDYGRYAEWCVKRGYKAIKLHTWMKPVSWAPDPKMDVKACAAVREAVGPDMPLMLDAYHGYSRSDALWLGQQLQKLGYAWYEEPMNEYSMSSYQWLAANLDIPVIGPETADGKHFTRAEWIKSGACDITRVGVLDVGGITPSLKVIHLAESFGMDCEVHGGGAGNLTICAIQKNGRFYERGLLHPFIDYDEVPQYLHSRADTLDDDGAITMPQRPGLGEDINFEYIEENLV